MSVLALATDTIHAAAALPMPVPDPGDGSMPPGFEKFKDVIGWVKWIALGIAVIGLIVLGASLAISSRRGEGMEIGGWLGRILIGVIIIAGAVGLVSFFVGA